MPRLGFVHKHGWRLHLCVQDRVQRRRNKRRPPTYTRKQIEEYILHNYLDLRAADTLRAADQRAVDDLLSQGQMNKVINPSSAVQTKIHDLVRMYEDYDAKKRERRRRRR